jgi:hypothetical protein
VVRLYYSLSGGSWSECTGLSRNIPAAFITDQAQNWNSGAGATQLNAATWTVQYWTSVSINSKTGLWSWAIYWGTTTYETEIQNFSYQAVSAPSVVVPVLDGLVFIRWFNVEKTLVRWVLPGSRYR